MKKTDRPRSVCWRLRQFKHAHGIAALQLPVLLVALLLLDRFSGLGQVLQLQGDELARKLFIRVLAAFAHHFHTDAGGDMGGVYGRIGGVDVLSAAA